MGKYFGTDGVRGVANTELTNRMAYLLGQAAALFMGPNIVIGKDTRLSGDMLEAAASAGIMSAGGTALLAGIVPTPAVALLVNELRADGGLVISASHNPPEYNGIKLFDANGFKLPDEVEEKIEAFIDYGGLESLVSAGDPDVCETEDWKNDLAYCSLSSILDGVGGMLPGDAVGVAIPVEDAVEIYVNHAVESVKSQGLDFSGLHIALDAGHGASALTSRLAFERLGARVTAINEDFNGVDINVECGSTCLTPLHDLMAECGADVGVAHDGDADRVMLMTPDGFEIDGDFVEAVLAIDMKERGVLAGDTAVSTVMCNLGFVKAMEAAGINVVQTKVGDRYVLEEMRASGYSIGGEQSGHMILLDYNSTGDGLMTACQFLAAVVRSGGSIADAVSVMQRFPQELINVRVASKDGWEDNAAIADAVRSAEETLGDTGRVLVRASGTEPLIRVMVEAASAEDAVSHAQAIAQVVERVLS
ncbi:MAG: phosphoglucosamine mutase [Eggerthellaceae bacterium]|nr:phosphoglucosamine mutase [Eggerthellaceae bacterium]